MTQLNRLAGSRCYLCGPMDNAGPDRGATWRQNITPFLSNLGIGVLDPTNKATYGKGNEDLDHLKDRQAVIDGIKHGLLVKNDLYNDYHSLMKEIVSLDLRMVDVSDFIILYINTDFHACGTYIEVATSLLQRKPIITMVEQGKINTPPFLIGLLKHEMIFDDWNNIQNYIKHIALDNKVNDLGRWKFFDNKKIFNNKNNL